MLALNRDYLGHDYHTDIITFDYCDEAIVPRGTSAAVVTTAADPTDRKPIAGDLFIGVETVADNARELGIAPRREMLRVIVHGVLHLCGYGDKTPEEARAMREKEDLYLNRFDETQL